MSSVFKQKQSFWYSIKMTPKIMYFMVLSLSLLPIGPLLDAKDKEIMSDGSIQKNLPSRFVAHRGANNEAPQSLLPKIPENSIPALVAAYNAGALYVECDVHLTLDRKIVVIHDDDLKRTARYNKDLATTLSKDDFECILNKNITQLSYDKELSQVDIGAYADDLDKKYVGTKIPLLEEFLYHLANHPERHLVIELKPGDQAIVPALKTLLDASKKRFGINNSQILIICFDYSLIQLSKSMLGEYRHLWLTIATPDKDEIQADPQHPGKYIGFYYRLKSKSDLEKAIALALQARLEGLDVEYDPQLIDADFVQRVHSRGLKLIVWTYPKDDTLEMANKMLHLGVDLINTNQPEFFFKHLTGK